MGFFGSYNTPKTEGLSLAVLYGYDGNGSQVHDECRQTYEKAHKLTKRAPPYVSTDFPPSEMNVAGPT